jgi:hypothetical protein
MTSVYYTNSYSTYRTQILGVQLQEATDYVSSTFVDMVALCSTTQSDQLLIKDLEMPRDIGGYFYNVSLVENTDPISLQVLPTIQTIFDIRSTSDDLFGLTAESQLAWTSVNILKNTTDPALNPLKTQLKKTYNLYLHLEVGSNWSRNVAWVWKSGGKTMVGLASDRPA